MEIEAGAPSDNGKMKVPIVSLPWDVEYFFSEQPPSGGDSSSSFTNEATLERLRQNDKRTQGMSVAEYATWSEYRHASFTWRKTKRFSDWVGLGIIAENKPNDDVLDILGFLTSEMVQNLTMEALRIQEQELGGGYHHSLQGSNKQQTTEGLFSATDLIKQPVGVRHIRLAFQRLQTIPKKHRAMLNGTRQQRPAKLRLVCLWLTYTTSTLTPALQH